MCLLTFRDVLFAQLVVVNRSKVCFVVVLLLPLLRLRVASLGESHLRVDSNVASAFTYSLVQSEALFSCERL